MGLIDTVVTLPLIFRRIMYEYIHNDHIWWKNEKKTNICDIMPHCIGDAWNVFLLFKENRMGNDRWQSMEWIVGSG